MLDIIVSKPLIQINCINKTYHSKLSGDVEALKNISLTLPREGMVFIVGKNGCGKSTFLNILGGLDSPTDGEFLYNGKKINLNDEKNADSYRRNRVGFIFQNYNLLEDETVFYNINLTAQLFCKSIDDVKNVIDQVGLKEKINSPVSELSGGQQQRVAIARALVKDADVILADEPTGNLDSETSEEIFKLLKQISKRKLVVVVSHDNDFAQNYGDRIISIQDGVIVNDNIKCQSFYNEPATNSDSKKTCSLAVKSLIGLGIKNLASKKGKSILTTVMLFLSVIVLLFSQMLISTSSEKILGHSLPQNNITQIFINQDKWISRGNGNIPLTYNKSTGTNFSYQGEKYVKDTIPYAIKGVRLDGNQEGLIISSTQDIKNLGFELYQGALELIESNYVYVSDYWIDENYRIATENEDYTQYIGQEILPGTFTAEKAILAGVYKTNYRKYVDWDVVAQCFKVKNNLKEKDNLFYINFLLEMKNKVFLTQEFILNNAYSYDYNNKTYYSDLDDGTRRWYGAYTVLFKTTGNQLAINDNVRIVNSYGKVITKSGIESDFILNEEEVLLSKRLYSALFEPNYVDGDIPQALGQTLDISLVEYEKDFELAKIRGKIVVGVIDEEGYLISVARTVARDFKAYGLDQNFFLANIAGIESTTLINFFDNARDSFDISVNSIISSNIYHAEESLKLVGYVFGFVAIVMTVITILLVVNSVMVLISSKARDIGILRSIGFDSRQIIFIYLLKIIVLSLIALICSSFGVLGSIHLMERAFVMDSSLTLAMISVEWQTIALGLSFVLLFPTLITYLCLRKFNKKKPVELIRES